MKKYPGGDYCKQLVDEILDAVKVMVFEAIDHNELGGGPFDLIITSLDIVQTELNAQNQPISKSIH